MLRLFSLCLSATFFPLAFIPASPSCVTAEVTLAKQEAGNFKVSNVCYKGYYSDRDALPENLGTTTAHERQKVQFRLMCVAQKRLCLSSLICLKGVVSSYTQATVPQLQHLTCHFSVSTVLLQISATFIKGATV